jgi:hypothetical protein
MNLNEPQFPFAVRLHLTTMTNAEELVTIATFPEPMEANMARSALASAGIIAFLQGETANSMIPVAFSSQLQVRPEDEPAARSVLDALTTSPQSLEAVTAAEIAAETDSQFDAEESAR